MRDVSPRKTTQDLPLEWWGVCLRGPRETSASWLGCRRQRAPTRASPMALARTGTAHAAGAALNLLARNFSFLSADLQSVLWLAPPWRFPTGRWLWRWSRLRAGAARRSDSDAQVARYPPAGRVFRSLIIAGLNESSNRVSRMS